MLADMCAEAFAERARRELQATGETVRKRTVQTLDELTPQEAQVARLAAGGQTNPEIGAQLFLSPRTVEWHLGQVFGKPGISSRKEPASALSGNGTVGAFRSRRCAYMADRLREAQVPTAKRGRLAFELGAGVPRPALERHARQRVGGEAHSRCARDEGADEAHVETLVSALGEELAVSVVEPARRRRSGEHTSALQSPSNLVSRLL